jgi:hypothetical protein
MEVWGRRPQRGPGAEPRLPEAGKGMRDSPRIWAPAALFAVLSLAAFSLRAWHGVGFLPFPDESEHFVGAKALAAGDVLYRTYVDAHGPVIFMLTQAFGSLFGWSEPVTARWICIALVILATAAVAGTPGGGDAVPRLLSVGLFLGAIASAWLMQGLYLVSYHTVAGLLLLVALAVFLMPAWRGVAIAPGAAATAGAALALLVFTAYAFAPSAVLLAISGLMGQRLPRLRTLVALVAGAAAGCAIVLTWMAVFADFRGYLAFHFAANQFFYTRYFEFSAAAFLRSLRLSAEPVRLIHSLGLACGAGAFAVVLITRCRRTDVANAAKLRGAASILTGLVAILLLDARGSAIFQDGAMVVAELGVFALVLGPSLASATPMAGAAGALVCVVALELSARQALATPSGLNRAAMATVPKTSLARSDAALFHAIRAIVRPDERILAVPYNPTAYLLADRLPMQGFYEWLPWDADYARDPVLGRPHDLCAALDAAPPPVILFDNWVVWDQFAPKHYMPCVVALLATHYVREPAYPTMFVRLDRANGAAPDLPRP